MTTRKVNLYSLCFLSLLPAFILWKFIVGHDRDWTFLFFMSFFMIIAWGIGIFLGLLLSAIVKRPSAEPYLYLSGQLAVILTMIVFTVISLHTEGKRPHELENVKDNHSFVNLEKSSYEIVQPDYVRTAFLKLESGFKDPNSFHLEKYASRWKDTVINSTPDTIYTVFFTYLKNNKALFAKVTVSGDSAVINLVDSDIKPEQDKLSTKAGVWARRGDLDDVKRSLQDLPDSTRDKILDILSQ